MKKILTVLMLITFLGLAGCQAQTQTAPQTGTLQVNVTWQTDVWKPGLAGIIVLPDTEITVHKVFSTEVFRTGVTDLLGVYFDETMPSGWYWVEAVHQPEGVQKSDYGKYWVAHMVHVKPGQVTSLDFDYNTAGGWKIK